MSILDLCLAGARDAFGHPFRNWDVRGWEEGRVPEDYVCWLYCEWETRPAPAGMPARQARQQMELFA